MEEELHLGGHCPWLDLCVLPLMIVKLHCPVSVLWNLRNCKSCDCFGVALASDIGGNESKSQTVGDGSGQNTLPPCHCFYYLQVQIAVL